MAVRRRDSVLDALVRLRRSRPGISFTEALIFLYVAENPGLNVAELSRLIDMTLATASRAARALEEPDGEGPALLRITSNADDRRGRRHYLSASGRAIVDELETVIRRATPIAHPIDEVTSL